MRITKSILCLLLLMLSGSAFADWAPMQVQDSLKQFYPDVVDVAWSRDAGYFVADFECDGFDTKVWFTTDGHWVMKQIDWGVMDEVPTDVFNAFAAGEYSDGEVQDVVWVQFPQWQSIVAVKIGVPNMETTYLLLYTPEGRLIRVSNVTDMFDVLGAATFL